MIRPPPPVPALLLVGVLALADPAPAHAQHGGGSGEGAPAGRLVDARLRADLVAPGARVAVRIDYRLRPPPDAEAVPVSAVAFDSTRIEEVRVRVEGGALRPVDLSAGERAGGVAPELLRAGRVPIPPGEDSLRLTLEYVVSGTGTGLYRIPVVGVEWPPEEAVPGTFVAEAVLPADLHVEETFPAVVGEVETTEEGARRYRIDLQVVPSLVSFRVREGEARFFTFTRTVDGAMLLLLLALGAWGWAVLRRHDGAESGEPAGR